MGVTVNLTHSIIPHGLLRQSDRSLDICMRRFEARISKVSSVPNIFMGVCMVVPWLGLKG